MKSAVHQLPGIHGKTMNNNSSSSGNNDGKF